MKKIVLGLIGLSVFLTTLSAEEIYATFNVEATKKANIAFSSSGIVEKIYVDIGSVVKAGDIIAKLNNDDIQAMLDIQKVSLKYTKLDLDRQEKVKNIIDKAKYDSYAYKYENAKAQVKYQQSLLDKTVLKAPFEGVIISKEIEIGDVVSAQMVKTTFQIQSKNERKLVLEFDQKYHGSVKVGDKFRYTIDGYTKEYEGVVSKIYPYASTTSRKIKAEVFTQDFVVGLFGDGYITTNR